MWAWQDVAATSKSMFYKKNTFNDRESKIPFFHQYCQQLIDEGIARDIAGR